MVQATKSPPFVAVLNRFIQVRPDTLYFQNQIQHYFPICYCDISLHLALLHPIALIVLKPRNFLRFLVPYCVGSRHSPWNPTLQHVPTFFL
jgi:hypothetical protein